MHVLILSKADVATGGVTRRLRQLGHTPVVVPTDQFPAAWRISRYHDGRLVLRGPDVTHRIPQLGAVWYRRMGFGTDLPDDTPRDVLRAVHQESRAFLHGLMASASVPVINHKFLIDHADRKPRQLSLAADVGLDVPATLSTTEPHEVRRFAQRVGGRLITKALTSFAVGPTDAPQVMMTRALGPGDLDDLDGLHLCPATFQEHLPKAKEFRVTAVGGRLFTASIDTRGLAGAETDWRRSAKEAYARWRVDRLPTATGAALLRLLHRLGLEFATADFVLTPEGRLVFLEVNPAGEYLWLDPFFDGQISEALGDHLARRCLQGASA